MKIFAVVTVIVLAVALFGVIPGGELDFREVKHIVLEWSLALFIALYFLKNKCLKLFLAWALIRTALGSLEMVNPKLITAYIQNVNFSLHTIFVCLIFYQVVADRLNRHTIKWILNGLCIIVLLQCLMMFLQRLGIWFYIIPATNIDPLMTDRFLHFGAEATYVSNWVQIFPMDQVRKVSGFLSHFNMAASLLALGLPAFFRPKWYWGIPLVCLALFFSHSLGGIIPATLALVALVCWKAGKHRYWIIPAVVSLCIAYVYKFDSFQNLLVGTGRIGTWNELITKIIPKRPIIGWGIGQYKLVFTSIHEAISGTGYIRNRMVQAHNDWIQLFIDTGFIGFSLAVGFIISLIVKGFRAGTNIAKIALIGLMATVLNSNVNFLFQTTPGIIGLLWFAILGKGEKYGN